MHPRYMYLSHGVARKRAHYGLSAHPPVLPQFPSEVWNLFDRTPTQCKYCKWGIPIVQQAWGCSETGLHTLQAANYTAIYTSTKFLAHDVSHDLHFFACLAVYNIDASNVSPSPCLNLMPNLSLQDYGILQCGTNLHRKMAILTRCIPALEGAGEAVLVEFPSMPRRLVQSSTNGRYRSTRSSSRQSLVRGALVKCTRGSFEVRFPTPLPWKEASVLL